MCAAAPPLSEVHRAMSGCKLHPYQWGAPNLSTKPSYHRLIVPQKLANSSGYWRHCSFLGLWWQKANFSFETRNLLQQNYTILDSILVSIFCWLRGRRYMIVYIPIHPFTFSCPVCLIWCHKSPNVHALLPKKLHSQTWQLPWTGFMWHWATQDNMEPVSGSCLQFLYLNVHNCVPLLWSNSSNRALNVWQRKPFC